MKVIDAYWEKRNLGVDTLEIEIDDIDCRGSGCDLKKNVFNLLDKNKYQYYVLKFNVGNIYAYKIANELGFKFVEIQFDYVIDKETFDRNDYSKIKRFNKLITNEYTDNYYYDIVVSKINEGLFYTDRIALDPYFGIEHANTRYSNWITDLIKKKDSSVYLTSSESNLVGFQINKHYGDTCIALLGGLFKDYQSSGLGLFLHYSNLNIAFKKYATVKTSLSSNNIKVIKLWQYFSAKMLRMKYVYVKHI